MPEVGNPAPVLVRMERAQPERLFSICEFIRGVLPNFDKFQNEERDGKASLRWKPKGPTRRSAYISRQMELCASLRWRPC